MAFFNQQGAVTLAQTCDPTTIRQSFDTATCTVTAMNQTFDRADGEPAIDRVERSAHHRRDRRLAESDGRTARAGPEVLEGKLDALPAIAPGDTPAGGYLDLEALGVAPVAVGDEVLLNFNVPGFVFGGVTYNRIGVTSNGYAVLGGSAGGADIQFTPQTLPDPARPNGVLAPYWTDLDGSGTEGVRPAVLSDGVGRWIVLQWDVRLFGPVTPTSARAMQIWIGVNGVEDVSFGYAVSTLGRGTPSGFGLTVGAENPSGTGGAQITGPPVSSYVITTSPGADGESLSYTLTILGVKRGGQSVTTAMTANIVAGVTRVSTPFSVIKR